jgi:hypothetical protein
MQASSFDAAARSGTVRHGQAIVQEAGAQAEQKASTACWSRMGDGRGIVHTNGRGREENNKSESVAATLAICYVSTPRAWPPATAQRYRLAVADRMVVRWTESCYTLRSDEHLSGFQFLSSARFTHDKRGDRHYGR